ncbi:SDR family NAD(P)-dependent oxidoreductase [Nocardioides sp. zg-536]|uniref:SDR family NAD(P)-dependent oxidoreductase n=1 Tax=Nocardioides faecalis TaxID=2803858 RepID=A0A938Y959_9ACTN|nr:SDR family NAD(P)-dependent oxidoreductase [Nocardioides faecalis]MBM9461600.1 SDR family NAD(P)-dependent oxidoreductase [Nocardioides faecalis]MBS4752490.1 SDR family NAD(P)-dependent oxidoreductase [Nocardioides faecalis]QVI57767.1 SDR family NAD(P)-dependent oxidoreductase [Nocardioides faecalis]
MQRLEGRVALVTGAGSGIGRVTAQRLARRGCDLALVDLRPEGVEETARLVRAEGRRASVHLADVSDAERMAALVDEVLAEHDVLHVLVNNAGITSVGAFSAERLEDLHALVDVNVWGVVHGCRFFLPVLRAQEEAHIVNVSSMAGLMGLPHTAGYALTKGAVKAFTEALRGELVDTSVGVSVVFPGTHRTGITAGALGADGARIAQVSSGRLAVLMPPPSLVARRIVKVIEKDRPRAVVGPDARIVDLASRIAPGRTGLIGRITGRLASH